jgi:hypothetical protein
LLSINARSPFVGVLALAKANRRAIIACCMSRAMNMGLAGLVRMQCPQCHVLGNLDSQLVRTGVTVEKLKFGKMSKITSRQDAL